MRRGKDRTPSGFLRERVPRPVAVPLSGGPDAVGIHTAIPSPIFHEFKSNSICDKLFGFSQSNEGLEFTENPVLQKCKAYMI